MNNSVVKFLDETASKFGDRVALLDGDDNITYNQYKSLGESIGSALINSFASKRKNQTIAVFLPKCYRYLISFMGVMYSGNIYVPIDSTMPEARLLRIFSNLEPDRVITDENLVAKLGQAGITPEKILIYDELIKTDSNREVIDKAINKIIDMDPIYIMYTSGSTGNPKGVVIPHKGVIDYINWVVECFDVDENTVMGNQSPFYFDNTVLDIYACLKTGAKLVIIPEVFFQFQAKVPEYLNEQRINFIFWVPTVYINLANSGVLEHTQLPLLKKALFCGEVMPNKQLNIWRKYLPDVQYANLYGPTEITDVCTYYIVDKPFSDYESLPIGIPCENTNIIILTAEDKEAAQGEIGELCIFGSGLALGYWREKELSDKVFIQNPVNDKYLERLYRTGDLVFLNEGGQLIFVGRKDSQIKHRGNRIELGEIETAAKSLENVHNACVLYDNDAGQIVMFLETDEELELKNIKRKMLALIPKYMLPGKIVTMNKLPYTPNQKIDRVKLRNEL